MQFAQYRFAKELQADSRGAEEHRPRAEDRRCESPTGLATITDAQVEPLAKGVPLKARFDASRRQLHRAHARPRHLAARARRLGRPRAPHPHASRGRSLPLHLDGDMTGSTGELRRRRPRHRRPCAPADPRLQEATLATHVAVRARRSLEFQAVRSQVGKSVIDGGLCSIGFDNHLRVDAPKSSIDLSTSRRWATSRSPGKAEAERHSDGPLQQPAPRSRRADRELQPRRHPFGNVTARARHASRGRAVDLKNVKAVKGKSAYEMPQARLEFGGKAKMQLDGVATTSGMGLRDFLSIWKMDDDPRFDDLDAMLATRASIHLAMGGPEDACGGGLIDVRAGVHATADQALRRAVRRRRRRPRVPPVRRAASMQGTDVTVRAMTLHKYHPHGKEPSGSILGSGRIAEGGVLHASVVMEAIPLFRVQSLGALRSRDRGDGLGHRDVRRHARPVHAHLRPRRHPRPHPRHPVRPLAPPRRAPQTSPPADAPRRGRPLRRPRRAAVRQRGVLDRYVVARRDHG